MRGAFAGSGPFSPHKDPGDSDCKGPIFPTIVAPLREFVGERKTTGQLQDLPVEPSPPRRRVRA
ncbi:hypothetical protein SAMN05444166_2482 [Singulisphaera sp. GP187]|nr:hypothetical protein SAMN05444166_2482 [Singulisphaera sp. GP187]